MTSEDEYNSILDARIDQSIKARQRGGLWRLWAKALGEKAGSTDREANIIACLRTIIVLSYILTNCFIIAGVIRHWYD